MVAKVKGYIDRLNPRYGVSDDKKRRQAEAFEALVEFCRRLGGTVVSSPGRFVCIEAPRGSELPEKLRELGYPLSDCGSVTRIVGATNYTKRIDEMVNGTPSPFAEYLVFETTLSGR